MTALSVPQQVAEAIKTAILTGEYGPRERLKGVALSERYGVSRATVHDALRILEQAGLVELLPRRGTYVRDFRGTELNEIFEIRSVLVGLAAARAAEHADDAFIAKMESHVGRLAELAVDTGPVAQDYGRESIDAQMAIAEKAGNRNLMLLLNELTGRAIWRAVYTGEALDHTTTERRGQSVAIWKELLAALTARDPQRAEALSRKLINTALQFLISRQQAVKAGAQHNEQPSKPPA